MEENKQHFQRVKLFFYFKVVQNAQKIYKIYGEVVNDRTLPKFRTKHWSSDQLKLIINVNTQKYPNQALKIMCIDLFILIIFICHFFLMRFASQK